MATSRSSVSTATALAPRTFRQFAGGGSSVFRAPNARDAAIHAKCVVRTFALPIGEGRPAIVRVVNAPTAAEADRCWSTPQAPEGRRSRQPRYWRADLMVARVGREIWVKGGTETDLLTRFAPALQRAYVEGEGDDAPALEWVESTHTFGSDGNRCHWMVCHPTEPLDLTDLIEFVEENAHLILRKDSQAARSDDSSSDGTEGFELRTGGYDLPARFHFVEEGEDVSTWRVGTSTAQVLVISSGRGKTATRWIKVQRGVRGVDELLTLIRVRDRGWEGNPVEGGGWELRGRVGESYISIEGLKAILKSQDCPLYTGGGFAR